MDLVIPQGDNCEIKINDYFFNVMSPQDVGNRDFHKDTFFFIYYKLPGIIMKNNGVFCRCHVHGLEFSVFLLL